MSFIGDIFAVKEKVWEGTNEETCEKNVAKLKEAGVYVQSFKKNQQVPKCTGQCGSCAAAGGCGENATFKEKLGSGCSDDLLKPKKNFDTYLIYVKEKELDKARSILNS